MPSSAAFRLIAAASMGSLGRPKRYCARGSFWSAALRYHSRAVAPSLGTPRPAAMSRTLCDADRITIANAQLILGLRVILPRGFFEPDGRLRGIFRDPDSQQVLRSQRKLRIGIVLLGRFLVIERRLDRILRDAQT